MTLGKEKDKHSYISFRIDIEIYFDIDTQTCKIRQIQGGQRGRYYRPIIDHP